MHSTEIQLASIKGTGQFYATLSILVYIGGFSNQVIKIYNFLEPKDFLGWNCCIVRCQHEMTADIPSYSLPLTTVSFTYFLHNTLLNTFNLLSLTKIGTIVQKPVPTLSLLDGNLNTQKFKLQKSSILYTPYFTHISKHKAGSPLLKLCLISQILLLSQFCHYPKLFFIYCSFLHVLL